MSVPITGFYAGLLALGLIILSARVGRQRRKHQVSLGAGGVSELERAIRAHGNFIEYVPLALLLLLAAELRAPQPTLLHGYGATLLVGRILHASGMGLARQPNVARILGTTLTLLVLLGLATVNLLGFFGR